jgi:hypothetical protein
MDKLRNRAPPSVSQGERERERGREGERERKREGERENEKEGERE